VLLQTEMALKMWRWREWSKYCNFHCPCVITVVVSECSHVLFSFNLRL